MRVSSRVRAGGLRLLGLVVLACGVQPVFAQEPKQPPTPPAEKSDFEKLMSASGIIAFPDRRPRGMPDRFLPPGNRRTSDPGIVRVYKKGKDGKALDPQPKDFPHKVDPTTYKPAEDEFVRMHEGIDLSSRDAKGEKRPLDFKAGVYGKVVGIGTDNNIGRITVEVDDRGNRVEYLHTSKTFVKVGDEVKPDTMLGVTGDVGAKGRLHLHVQARNKDNKAINPDEVVVYAKKPPAERKMAEFFVPMKPPQGVTPASADHSPTAPVPAPPPTSPPPP